MLSSDTSSVIMWWTDDSGLFPSGVLSLRIVAPFSLRSQSLDEWVSMLRSPLLSPPTSYNYTGTLHSLLLGKLLNKAGLTHPLPPLKTLLNKLSPSHSPHEIENVPQFLRATFWPPALLSGFYSSSVTHLLLALALLLTLTQVLQNFYYFSVCCSVIPLNAQVSEDKPEKTTQKTRGGEKSK